MDFFRCLLDIQPDGETGSKKQVIIEDIFFIFRIFKRAEWISKLDFEFKNR